MHEVSQSEGAKLQIQDMLCFDAYSINQAFGQVYKKLLGPIGITYPQYLVFISLWSQDAQTMSELGDRLGLESSTLTPLIKRLETKGYLVRTRDEHDERRVIITLTQEGKMLEKKARDIPNCVAQATGLSHDDFENLHLLLKRTKKSLSGAK